MPTAHTVAQSAWFKAAEEVGLIMTSSACTERIFSLYDGLFSDRQECALADRREATMMIKFNSNQLAREDKLPL
jgi:hypothetical protein